MFSDGSFSISFSSSAENSKSLLNLKEVSDCNALTILSESVRVIPIVGEESFLKDTSDEVNRIGPEHAIKTKAPIQRILRIKKQLYSMSSFFKIDYKLS